MTVIASERARRLIKAAVPYLLIPAAVACGVFVFDEKRYAFVSLAVAALAALLFMAGYEKRKTGTRRLIIVAVMTALSVAGRFIPFFKPVTALTVITAVYLGGEAGFLVGALSALISNIYFGQGPWTPFQMFAWGMIGLFAGLLAAPLKKSRIAMLVYGAFSGVFFSLIMDMWTVLWYSGGLSWGLYMASAAAAAPHTLLYAASNVAFLALCAKPFGDKLERVKLKYGV